MSVTRAMEKQSKKGHRKVGRDYDFRQHNKEKPEGDEEVSRDMGSCLTGWKKNIQPAQIKTTKVIGDKDSVEHRGICVFTE